MKAPSSNRYPDSAEGVKEGRERWVGELEHPGKEKPKDLLRQITRARLAAILATNLTWYEAGGDDEQGEPARLAGTDLNQDGLRHALPRAQLFGAGGPPAHCAASTPADLRPPVLRS
jgi:hypothetical protein